MNMHLVTRGARRATRIVCGGAHRLTGYKRAAHRRYRRRVHALEALAALLRDVDKSEFDPTRAEMVTGWEVA